MNFTKHSELEGKHAFLSPSNYHWVNYDKEKAKRAYRNTLRKLEGTELHRIACDCIKHRIYVNNEVIGAYVRDVIDYNLTPEQILYYSPLCYGTADAIGFETETLTLYVFDLKTGEQKANMMQLRIYAALFFLEYGLRLGYKPGDCTTELRIYQNSREVEREKADPDEINQIMIQIVDLDQAISEVRGGTELWME